MLYVYIAKDWESGKEFEEITNCKELKDWNGSFHFGKTESIVSNGKEIKAYITFNEYVRYYWDECVCENTLEINEVFEVSIEHILDYMTKDERYDDRIYNSTNPFIEVRIIINEIGIELLKDAMEDLQNMIEVYKTYK